MRKILLSFASSNFATSLARLDQQARDMKFYDEVHCVNESHLDPDFRNKFKRYLKFDVKGFGYWCWKPQIVLQMLDRLDEGDVILYVDAGCHLNTRGRKRLEEYFEIVSTCSSGILAFQSGLPTPEIPRPKKSHVWLEREWTKGDLLDHFDARDDQILNRGQIVSGVFLIRKCPQSMEFMNSWKDVYFRDMSLVDNSKSITPNCPEFKKHRHDQSVFSLLCAKMGATTVSYFEIGVMNATEEKWKKMWRYPVHARRDRPLIKKSQRNVTGIFKLQKRIRFAKALAQNVMQMRRPES
ncbi:MAG: hypothetical protein AAF362_07690 [Pseudomonadota bacterium]